MIIKYRLLILTLILILGVFFRFHNLTVNPPSFNWDEAALGYNAYTLGIDGRDEFGVKLPISYIESFGDFKPVAYSYLALIPVKVFGLNEFAVRFPSALLGVFFVLITYLLVKEIFKKNDKLLTEKVALTASLFIAVSPWHTMLSRGAYEANVSTFFIALGVLFFLKALNKNSWYLVLSTLAFVVPFYTFNTPRVFLPLFFIALIIFFRKKVFENKIQTVVSGFIGLILILPLVPFLLSPQAQLRYEEVNIFSNPEIIETSNTRVQNDNNSIASKIINNRRVLYTIEFSKHYLDNFNPNFLFIHGDGNPRFSTKDVGQMYLFELPFLIIGSLVFIRKRPANFIIIPLWILIGIIPAATARETPHALRIENILPTLQILSAFGFIWFLENIKKYKKVVQVLLSILVLISVIYFYHGLNAHYSRNYSSEWQYPYKELVPYVENVKNDYEKIEITSKLGRPYIFFLVYGKYSPNYFRENAGIEREAYGFVHVNSLGNYEFKRSISNENLKEDVLYIADPEEITDYSSIEVLKEFRNLNNSVALIAYIKK